MTLTEISRQRLVNQQLSDSKIKSAVKMVEWFVAMQGQEYAQTKWSLGLRLPELIDNDIEDDLNKGKILRTHLLRPTWHFVSHNDIGWLLSLTAPRVHAANKFMYRQLELDNKIFSRCNDLLITSLEGENHSTRDRLNEVFKKNKVIATGHRLSYIMMNAELEGIICSGVRQGNQFTYALLDERVKSKKTVTREESLAELTTRYFTSRGPATLKDFSTWSGLTIRDCKIGVDVVKGILKKEVIDDHEYFFNPLQPLPDRQTERIFLLPIYDEFIMGYKDKSMIMTLRNKAPFSYDSMIIFNGQVIGTWKRTISKTKLDLEVDFFKPLNKLQRKSFKTATDRLGEYLSLSVLIS